MSINPQHVVLGLVCLFGVGFMTWFLVALALDDKRMRRERLFAVSVIPSRSPKISRTSSLRTHKNSSASNTGLGPAIRKGGRFTPISMAATLSPVHVYRLKDKHTEDTVKLRWLVMALVLSAALRTSAQSTTQPATTPAPLPTPSMTGPLQAAAPIAIDAGALGKLELNGVVSGMALGQSNPVAGDNSGQAALSNGQVFIQKTAGWWQFYIQAGAYNIPALGTPFLATDKTVSDLWGPVPVAYLKLVPGKNTAILIGELPALMGAEYTFDFQNMNIEPGLLWNQENSVNRGIQLNQTLGKVAASISWNDGYYSNRYSWLSGSLTYTNGPHGLEFIAMGNLGQTVRQTLATPAQNNGSMYAVIYIYTKGKWTIEPYYQHGSVPRNARVGVAHGASTNGGALLVSRTLTHGFSLAGRGEYITSTGTAAQQAVNLVYGPGSGAWSLTATPSYQYQRFFVRGEISLVRANDFTPGSAFGPRGRAVSQARGVVEVGFCSDADELGGKSCKTFFG